MADNTKCDKINNLRKYIREQVVKNEDLNTLDFKVTFC